MASRALLHALLIFALLLSNAVAFAISADVDLDIEEEDLSFLEDDEDDVGTSDQIRDASDHESYEQPPPLPPIDEKDVVVLTGGNFSEFLEWNRHVVVEFYAPWCRHCKALAPDYAAAATELEAEEVALAKVDCIADSELAQRYDVQGFPTLYFFADGVHKAYTGQMTKDAIVTWIKKKISSSIHNITTTEEVEKILAAESKVVLGFLDSLVGGHSEELTAASELVDDVSFYQTVNPDVAELFHIDPKSKRRPSLVMVNQEEEEKLTYFDGQEFTKSAIVDFVLTNKLSSVITLTRESEPLFLNMPIKKQLLLFSTSSGSKKVIQTFQEAAKLFKGKLIFVYVEIDNEDMGKPVAEFFGVTGDGPKVFAFTIGNDDGAKKYALDSQVTLDNIKKFAEGFIEDKLQPFYKSDPIPETNDGKVKIVVGHSFDEIVLDESKDVLLNVYAAWCGFCKALEPTYNKLAKHLGGIKSLVIAKLDGTTNEHPRVKVTGFPTLFFFPAGNKSSDPITVDTNRTVVALYKFIKEHASIPFKLERPASATKSVNACDSATPDREPSDGSDVKDEL